MNEDLFQYLWKNALFLPQNLKTTKGEQVTVINTGIHNTDAGPDFLEAKIKIGNTIWVGNVELHLKTSDWQKHKHHTNPIYANIILHVVYENDNVAQEHQAFETLELKNNLPQELIEKYYHTFSLVTQIPCGKRATDAPPIVWKLWEERLLAERFERRKAEWQQLWQAQKNDWRKLLYYRLAANFGFKTNRDAFLQLALSIPLNILEKHSDNLQQIEAILFGQSGLLQTCKHDDYTQKLEREYNFFRRKYELTPLLPTIWKFLRLRPSNFPTIRIAQFAQVIYSNKNLFAKFMEIKKVDELIPLLQVTASSYWNNHYKLGEISTDNTPKNIGTDAINNIAINTIAPMQYIYAQLQGNNNLLESSRALLSTTKSENNNIIKEWKSLGIKSHSADTSQALIELYDQYCAAKKCLQCSIGNSLMKR